MTVRDHALDSRHFAETLPADQVSLPADAGPLDDLSHLETIGRERYVLGNEIAQGGIGRILRASDERLKRPVALKELLDPSPENEARFLREALVTARLQHPAIVPVYDVGRLPDGEIFYAMKLVSGRSLAEVVGEADSFDKRLALLPHVIAVAEAIAYAHSERIVHRDLKPANVLIGPFGETVVIDWGIAKDLREVEDVHHPLPGRTSIPNTPNDSGSSLTMAGAILGTPGYMPPEQAAGDPVDERADVYALGAILYHVLAGAPPYEGKSVMEVLTKVLTEDPPSLATRARGVPSDLLAVVHKAMARDAAQRYPTANEFAHDLRLFQTGQIVGAHQYSRRERAIRFVQKHRSVVAAALLGLVITTVVGFTSLSRVLAARRMAEMERDRANDERAWAQQKQSEAEAAHLKTIQQSDELILLQARAAARSDPNAAIAWLSSLSDTFHRWSEARLIAADAQAYGIAKVLRGHSAALNMTAYSADGQLIATASDDRTIGIWTADGKLLRKLEGHTDEVWRVAFMRDGKQLVSTSKDGTVRLWDLDTGQTLRIVRTSGYGVIWAHFIDEGNRVLLMSCGNKRLELHDLTTGAVDPLPGELTCPGTFTLSPDQRTVAYVADGNGRILRLDSRQFRDYPKGQNTCRLAIMTQDQKHFACAGTGNYVSLWETYTGRQLEDRWPTRHPGHSAIQFSPDGKQFAFADDSTLYVRDLEKGTTRVFRDHRGPIFIVGFSPDSRWVATGSADRTVVLRDLIADTRKTYFGFRDTTSWITFSPNHPNLLVGSWDNTARIFPIGTWRDRILAQQPVPMIAARFSHDGQALLSIDQRGTVRIEAIENGANKPTRIVYEGQKHISSPDGRLIAFSQKNGTVHVRKAGSMTNEWTLEGHAGTVLHMRFSPKNERLLSVGSDNMVRLWDLTSGQGKVGFSAEHSVTEMAFSPDVKRFALGDAHGVIRVFSIQGELERTLEGHTGNVDALVFLPDGKRLASGGLDHTLRIWDLATGNARTIDASGLGILRILVSPDGSTLYTLGTEASIRRWEVETGKALPVLRGHEALVTQADLSPDGSRLVSASIDGAIRLWDLATAQSRTLEGHDGPLAWVGFSPRGDKLASAGEDGTIRIWHDDLPFDTRALRAWMTDVVPEKISELTTDH